MSLGLYKFYWDCGRMGALEGIFIEDKTDVKNLIGKTIYFGEVLGKHSEIRGELEAKDLTLVTDNPDFIAAFENYVGDVVGYNPFDYYDKDIEEE